VPDMIRFYLSEEPVLQNVPTWQCRKPADLSHVLANLPQLVVKEAQGSGGYGMLIGPAASQAELEDSGRSCKAEAGSLHRPADAGACPPARPLSGRALRRATLTLRPFVLAGKDSVRLVPGGLTRVALKAGSLVVNSSQGGGTKDTWVLAD
jgi:uncharacterized circularly permuted ATP-grasp superfamily protein